MAQQPPTDSKADTGSTDSAHHATESVQEHLQMADRWLLPNYRPARMMLTHGRGSRLFDSEGNGYLDFCAGVAVCCLGHAHPDLTAALQEQAGRLIQTSNYFYNLENVNLAAELCQATGYDRAFFCNSGAEANEALLKLARRHFHEQGKPRLRTIAFKRAFHGRTMGALALTGNPKYLLGYGTPLAGIEHVDFGDLDGVRERMGDDVASIHVEPLQGEGGVVPAPAGFLAGLRELCDKHGTLLMFDEVQSGVGRTGKMLAAEHSGVQGDAVALAKGMGGGIAIGAMLVREHLAGSLPPGAHGSTFGGNPLASAVARTVLRIIERDGLLDHATRMGQRLDAGLARLSEKYPDKCVGTRGLGLLRALLLVPDLAPRELLPRAREEGLLITAAGPSALRFTPPLNVSESEIDEAVHCVDSMLAKI